MTLTSALKIGLGLALAVTPLGAGSAIAQTAAPVITVQGAPADGSDEAAAPAASEAAPPAAAKKTPPAAAPAKKKSAEVLPWANQPKGPAVAPMTATGEDAAAVQAAAAQCNGQFEASCRDLKTCAWVADMAAEDGSPVPARCVARPPAPPKKSAKKQTPAKKADKTGDAGTTVPAPPVGKAVVTSVEEVPAAAPPAKPPKKKAAKVEVDQTSAEEPAPKTETKVVVKPPAATAPASTQEHTMPGFGAVSPTMGGGNAVVVTVPPSE